LPVAEAQATAFNRAPVQCFAGREVAVFGLGGSGLATAHALKLGGAKLACWDDGETGRTKAAAEGLPVVDLLALDFARFAALILSPGVPLTHPEPHWTVQKAKAAGVEIIGDIELFCRERARVGPDAPFIAITGTNGKSTTTALIAHLLGQAGLDVQMGGNIGTNILDLAPAAANRHHVIELSTFQIDLTPSLKPSIGVMLNLTPDHLDRHGTMEAYAAIKERIVSAAGLAVCGVDDSWSKAMANRRAASGNPLVRFSTGRLISGISAQGGRIAHMEGGEETDIATLASAISLRGTHNAQNAAAAVAVALASGLPARTIQAGLNSFTSLPHRMELVGRVGRVAFINDSKATNADSTRGALAGAKGIHWIIGGKAKEGGIEELRHFFGNITRAYLIGAASDLFAKTLDGAVPFERCVTLDKAVASAASAAASDASADPVVLLSPACASYDQFKSFEHRGQYFRELVRALPGFVAHAGGQS
jgi:UDP-N-acetylmuramoylalanine--D-glutamate ligase